MKVTIFKMMFLCLCGVFSLQDLLAQQTINAASHSAQIEGMQFDYSIGEMMLVSTEHMPSLIVTQGYLQPFKGQVSPTFNETILSDNNHLKVYPNPTQNILFVESDELQSGIYNYKVLDATGKIVWSSQKAFTPGITKTTIDLQSFASGNYFLQIVKNAPNNENSIITYKITKSN